MRLVLVALLLGACAAPGEGAPESTTHVLRTSAAPAPSSAATGSAATLAWRRIPDITTGRSEVAATAFRNEVYVFGGFGGGRVVEIFDGQRWRRGPDLPFDIDHAMAAAVEESPVSTVGAGVYVFGGNNAGAPIARSFRLAPGATAWREIAAMPGPRSQAAAVARGTSIYVVGGYDGQRLVAPTYAYDAAADRWRQVASIPTTRDHLAAAMIAGRICAIGGRKLSLATNLATLECYEPGADRWEAMPDAPTPRGGVGAAAVGDRLIFVGGEQLSGTYKEVELFDFATQRWSRLPDLPTPRHGIGVVAVGRTVYVMTGGPTPGSSQTPVSEALDLPAQ
ncbi:MAG TPA: kelch repeat-containing protein [Candidatus Limnocylindria bacterium]|nr:kelch repeat-containing protein [Candidatus Limnocylindria bacterium]